MDLKGRYTVTRSTDDTQRPPIRQGVDDVHRRRPAETVADWDGEKYGAYVC
jgi:hypothetical protein